MLSLSGQAMSPLRSLQLPGLPLSVSMTMIFKALGKIKCSSSVIIAEMLKAAGEEVVQLAKQLTGAVFSWAKFRNSALRILRQSFAVDGSYCMDSMPRSVSKLPQTFRFSTLEAGESLERHGLNVWRLMSVILAWLALTCQRERDAWRDSGPRSLVVPVP